MPGEGVKSIAVHSRKGYIYILVYFLSQIDSVLNTISILLKYVSKNQRKANII